MSFGASTNNTSGNTDTTALLNQLFNQISTQTQNGTTASQESGQTSGQSSGQTSGQTLLQQMGQTAGQQTGTTAGQQTGATARTLTPDQIAAESNIARVSKSLSTNPQAFVAPAQNLAREQVNQNYAGLGESLRQQFLSGGGGSSGKYGTAALAGDLQRRSQLSNVDNQAAATSAMLPVTGAQLSQNLLNTNLGETSTGAQTGTSSGAQTGTSSGTQAGTSSGTTSGQQTGQTSGQQTGQTSQTGTTDTSGSSSSKGVTNATMGQSTNEAHGKI